MHKFSNKSIIYIISSFKQFVSLYKIRLESCSVNDWLEIVNYTYPFDKKNLIAIIHHHLFSYKLLLINEETRILYLLDNFSYFYINFSRILRRSVPTNNDHYMCTNKPFQCSCRFSITFFGHVYSYEHCTSLDTSIFQNNTLLKIIKKQKSSKTRESLFTFTMTQNWDRKYYVILLLRIYSPLSCSLLHILFLLYHGHYNTLQSRRLI